MDIDDVLSRTCACVLAAGGSARMGRPKQLLEIARKPLAARACAAALTAGAAEVCLVAGAAFDQVAAAVEGLPVSVVANGCWESGQASSVRQAVRYAWACGADWLLVLPVDMPHVDASHLRALADAAAQGAQVAASASPEGTPMAPCLFTRSAFPLLEGLSGDRGAVAVLRGASAPADLALVPFTHLSQAEDVDTPEQFARAKRAIEASSAA